MACERKLASVLLGLGVMFAGVALEAQQSRGEPGPAGEQANTTAPPQPARLRLSAGAAAGVPRERGAPEDPQKTPPNTLPGVGLLDAAAKQEGGVTELSV